MLGDEAPVAEDGAAAPWVAAAVVTGLGQHPGAEGDAGGGGCAVGQPPVRAGKGGGEARRKFAKGFFSLKTNHFFLTSTHRSS